MEFGLDKCMKVTFIRRRLTSVSDMKLDESTSMKELDQQETNKYLGKDKGNEVKH